MRLSLAALDLRLSLPCRDGDLLPDTDGVAFLFLAGLWDRLRSLGLGDRLLALFGDNDGDCRRLTLSGDLVGDLRLLTLSGDRLGDLRLLDLSGDRLGDLRLLVLAGDREGDRLNLIGDRDGERRLLGLSGDRDGERRLLAGDWCRLNQLMATMSKQTVPLMGNCGGMKAYFRKTTLSAPVPCYPMS